MPDVVRAKLCKARALARRGATDITTKAEALALFREALTRNPNAGVKKEIATLAREVKKLSADGGTGEGGAASTDKTDGTVEPVPEKTTTASAAGKAATRKTTTKTATGKATKRKPVSQKKN